MNVAYFDYNATHPPFKEILIEANKNYIENYFNPSGPTRFSLSKQGLIEEARTYFANISKKEKDNFIFSSTGTEANTVLIQSIKTHFQKIYVSPFEHSSIFETLYANKIEFEIIQTDKSGLINLNDLEEKQKKDPAPLILIYAANETGVIQNISESKKILEYYNMPIFSDLMQAFCKIEIDFSILNGFTFSGHKIGAGLGASLTYLDKDYIKKDFALFKGGNQENNHRAGTENTSSIEAFMNSAKKQISEITKKNSKLIKFRNKIESELKNLDIEIIAENSPRLDSTIFAILPIEEVDFFMLGLEEKKILISNGSSCKSRSREPSISLLKMGYSKEESLRAIRISMGYFTNEEEVERLILGIREVLNALR